MTCGRAGGYSPRLLHVALLVLATWLVGCNTTVASGLTEEDANRAVVALSSHGLSAKKTADEQREGQWLVGVPPTDASSAIEVLARENLPPQRSPGVLEALGPSSIVPSLVAEHARLVAGTAGDLERSLQSVDGVLSARVHLAIADTQPLDATAPQPASASVLVRHRGPSAPLAVTDVQRLVAGAVVGLDADHVEVILSALPGPSAPGPAIARVGPLSVALPSLALLKFILAAGIALHLALIAAVVTLWLRLRRVSSEHDETASGARP